MPYTILLTIHLIAVTVGAAAAVRVAFRNDSLRWSVVSLGGVVSSGIALLVIQPEASLVAWCKLGLLVIMLGYAGVALRQNTAVHRAARVSLLAGWIGVIIASIAV